MKGLQKGDFGVLEFSPLWGAYLGHQFQFQRMPRDKDI
jgi:hypothetical protein